VHLLVLVLDIQKELSHDSTGNSETEAAANHGVHSDDTSVRVSEWAARIARIQADVCLDYFDPVKVRSCSSIWTCVRLSLGTSRLEDNLLIGGSTSGNHADRHGSLASERIAHRHHQLTYSQSRGISDLRGTQPLCLHT
jgi:hypothetical protein